MTRPLIRLLTAGCAAALLLATLPAQAAPMPLEDYAPYQPQTRCSPKAKPGTTQLSRWIVYRFDGGYGPISRACTSGGASEHKEGPGLRLDP